MTVFLCSLEPSKEPKKLLSGIARTNVGEAKIDEIFTSGRKEVSYAIPSKLKEDRGQVIATITNDCFRPAQEEVLKEGHSAKLVHDTLLEEGLKVSA